MIEIKTLFIHDLCLFVTKAFNVIFIHTKFNFEGEGKTIFNQLIEAFKLSKWQINCLMNVP